jgi:nucleotide-binding universal stress UspA family protein
MITFKKILFPTDFSTNANHALEHAVRLADFHKGEVIVQHVVNNYFSRYPHWSTLFDIHELQKHMDIFGADEMTKILAPYSSSVTIKRVISKGKPAEEIVALAEKELVDLIVMGSAKGVITNKVIRTTTRPVLAVSATGGPHDGEEDLHIARKILVATDFSEHSKKVVRYAFELKEAFNASIYLLYVMETSKAVEFALKQTRLSNTTAKMKEWAFSQLVNLTPDEFMQDPRVVRMVETGSPSDIIATVAREIGADLTILGTHEYGLVQKAVLGTTTDKLLTKIGSPVLTVKL